MKQNRRHYPRYVTHSYLQAAMIEQSQKQPKKRLTPFAWLSVTFFAALMIVGAIAFAQMLQPVRSEAAVAQAESVKTEMQVAANGAAGSFAVTSAGLR